jgi:hypothetical protein
MAFRINRVYFNAAAPGTGNLTQGTAVIGFRTLGANQNGASFNGVFIVDASGNWEARSGCVFTNSTSILTRGVLEDSSTGSAINFTAAVTVFIDSSAKDQALVDTFMSIPPFVAARIFGA